MSVFDLPRLHFRGEAMTHLPADGRDRLVDLAQEGPLPGRRPPGGPFSAAEGEDLAGHGHFPNGHFPNGHFLVDAEIVGVECRPGDIDTADPVVGRAVDMRGNRDEGLATTVDRARAVDVDPSSDWATALLVGQFCFGRDGRGRSQDVQHMVTGAVHGFHPPRWHNAGHGADVGNDVGDHGQAKLLRRSVVHQFVVTDGEDLTWLDTAAVSPAVRRLRDRVASADFGGLVVQFALSHLSAPDAPDRPGQWQLRGTIAPWRPYEPRTYPAGRLLVPGRRASGRPPGGPHNLCVDVSDTHVTLNMITALPASGPVPDPGSDGVSGPPTPADLGDLELRTADSAQLVARIPRQAYLGGEYALAGGGLVTVPAELSADAAAAEALHLVGTGPDGPVVFLREKEINVQVDDACLLLEQPRSPHMADHDVEVLMRSYVRGRPRAVGEIVVRQFFDPRSRPYDPVASSPEAWSCDVDIVRLRAGRGDDAGTWASSCVLDTDREGLGRLTLRGATAGTTRVLLSTEADDMPCAVDRDGSAALAYDHDDALGYWPGAGYLSARVLPGD